MIKKLGNKANIDLIKRAINSFDWEKAFSNIDIDKMVSIFNQTIINILCNFIPHETVLFDDRDPPWMNKEIKKLIHEKKSIFICFRRNNNDKQLLDRLNNLQTQLNFLTEKSKGKYYSRLTSKLSDIGKRFKGYWSILKSFLIGENFHVFYRYLKTMNILQISRKNRNYSIHFLQTSGP